MSRIAMNVVGFAAVNAILGTGGLVLVPLAGAWCLGAALVVRKRS